MRLDFTRIGQIGLGYMGSALAQRLQALGKTAIGHDIDAGRSPRPGSRAWTRRPR
jgi:3-hydroxyisobutyrate dehydrogenase-like beta-hydroxyacid dehydrogenase